MKRRILTGFQGFTLLFLSTAFLGGCATTGTTSAGNGPSNVLTGEQIMSVRGADDLYEVVEHLRPQWLARGAGNARVMVWRGQSFIGQVDVLRSFRPSSADRMEFTDGTRSAGPEPFVTNGFVVAGVIYLHTANR